MAVYGAMSIYVCGNGDEFGYIYGDEGMAMVQSHQSWS